MNWKTLTLFLVAWSTFAPFANASVCADSSCCAQMQSCCGHCHCTPGQTCQVAKPPPIDQQVASENVHAAPRVEMELFTLHFNFASELNSNRISLFRLPESPPPGASQIQQAHLCLWLI